MIAKLTESNVAELIIWPFINIQTERIVAFVLGVIHARPFKVFLPNRPNVFGPQIWESLKRNTHVDRDLRP